VGGVDGHAGRGTSFQFAYFGLRHDRSMASTSRFRVLHHAPNSKGVIDMGQSAVGVVYGCRLPEGIYWYSSELEDFEHKFGVAIGWNYDSTFRPVSIEGQDDVPVIGVLVAVSGSGKNGAADLWPTLRLTDISLLPETVKARATWEQLVAWCKARQLEVPEDAELWIVTTETA
jgi:hypothetical protein